MGWGSEWGLDYTGGPRGEWGAGELEWGLAAKWADVLPALPALPSPPRPKTKGPLIRNQEPEQEISSAAVPPSALRPVAALQSTAPALTLTPDLLSLLPHSPAHS